MEQLVNNFNAIAESFLYHGTFPINIRIADWAFFFISLTKLILKLSLLDGNVYHCSDLSFQAEQFSCNITLFDEGINRL